MARAPHPRARPPWNCRHGDEAEWLVVGSPQGWGRSLAAAALERERPGASWPPWARRVSDQPSRRQGPEQNAASLDFNSGTHISQLNSRHGISSLAALLEASPHVPIKVKLCSLFFCNRQACLNKIRSEARKTRSLDARHASTRGTRRTVARCCHFDVGDQGVVTWLSLLPPSHPARTHLFLNLGYALAV